MASVKLATLAVRTAAKPISNQLKVYAESSPRFRGFCIGLAQLLWTSEVRLRENLLGEPHGSVRKLSEIKAVQNGANFLAEGFLFSVAAGLILAEQYRTARNTNKRREGVDDRIEDLEEKMIRMANVLERLEQKMDQVDAREQVDIQRNEEVSRILTRIIDFGLRGGWAEFEHHPTSITLPPDERTTLSHLHPPISRPPSPPSSPRA